MAEDRSHILTDDTPTFPQSPEELMRENQDLLTELELAYTNMERILEEASREKEIAYNELQKKFDAVENLYNELIQKQNLLIHMQKLSSIGEFVAELLHELRNPLNVILLQAQTALLGGVEEATRQRFQAISQEVERVTRLINRFRATAYKGKEGFHPFDLNDRVAECMETIEIIKPKSIVLQRELCNQPLMVLGDPYQMDQVFFNLARNAFDEMKGRGRTLLVKTEKTTSEEVLRCEDLNIHCCRDRTDWEKVLQKTPELALVQFRDEGMGITPENLCRIFQPFFTTKERGKGTGLGLSISSDITLRHGGNLVVSSTCGQGATFSLLLPLGLN